ncbi:hypothetical protein, partial [Streptomyces spectabilis]|uniref:hypothetical protein n=1 Tax=Streptomyces spectabilis TaxID=68270 RepID=UPI003F4D452A
RTASSAPPWNSCCPWPVRTASRWTTSSRPPPPRRRGSSSQLAAVHAARVATLMLDDVDLGNRRLTIAGRVPA